MAAATSATFSRSYLEQRLESLRPSLYSAALAQLPPEDAQDAVQDAIAAALDRWHTYDPARGEGGLANWLHGILRNRITFCRRRKRKEANALERWAQLQTETAHAWEADVALRSDLRILLRYTPLSPRQEECLLSWLDGEKGKETAARLGIGPAQVTRHRQAAIAHLALAQKRGLLDQSESGFRINGEYVSFAALCRVVRYFPPVKMGTKLWREKWQALR